VATLIRTSDLPAKRRHDAWLEVVCDTLGLLDVWIDRDAPLEGEIEVGQVGSVGVGRVQTTTRHSVHRTAGLIRRDSTQAYRVVLPLTGRLSLAQDGRATRLEPGELAVYDFARPYDLSYDSAVRLAVFSFPHEALALPAGALAGVTAVPITPDDGAAALAGPLLHRVALDHESYQPVSAGRLATVMTDLVTTAIAERIEQAGALTPDAQDRTLLLRVNAFIEEHLDEVDLSPRVVAAAHHVSLRHLHRLFEAQDVTVAAWIRQRRLERCRAELADASLRSLPVSAVGARWGLPDSAHFSRLFRRTYGVSPTDYRSAQVTTGG
jgi:AraC-like DNA-binding protein